MRTEVASLPNAAPDDGNHRRWVRGTGVESLGQVQGSGLREPTYLVRRSDGQVVQVSELIHLVLMQLEAGRTSGEAAIAVSEAFGRRLNVAGLDHLVRAKLVPLGLVQDLTNQAAPSAAPVATPLLGKSVV